MSYAYQWVRVASGGVETDIADATSDAYTVTQGDLGVALKVKTTFTDDKGNPESAESALTAVVTVAQVVVSFGPVQLPMWPSGRRPGGHGAGFSGQGSASHSDDSPERYAGRRSGPWGLHSAYRGCLQRG